MESPKRTFVKALTWQASGLAVMTMIGFLITGSMGAGGSIAGISALSGIVFYMIHERLWARVSWGRLPSAQPSSTPPISSSSA